MELDKCDDLSWFSTDKLPTNLLEYVRVVIETMNDNNPLIESGWK